MQLNQKQSKELDHCKFLYDAISTDPAGKSVSCFVPKMDAGKRVSPQLICQPSTCLVKIQNVLGNMPRLIMNRELGFPQPKKTIRDLGVLLFWKDLINTCMTTDCRLDARSDCTCCDPWN